MKRRWLRLAVYGVLVALATAGYAYWYGFIRKEKPIEKMKPDFELSADSLFSVFNADEKAATLKFGGKTLLLKASIISVDKD